MIIWEGEKGVEVVCGIYPSHTVSHLYFNQYVVQHSSLFRPDSIFLEKEETSFFRALSLIPCNTEHKEVKVINLMKTCPSTKELQQSFQKLKELCVLETSKDFWNLDDHWLSSVETSRYCLKLKLFNQKDLIKAPYWLTHGNKAEIF